MSYNSKITLKLCKEIFPEFNEADVYWQCIDTEHGKQAGGDFLGTRN